jgi:hypothetical protein
MVDLSSRSVKACKESHCGKIKDLKYERSMRRENRRETTEVFVIIYKS